MKSSVRNGNTTTVAIVAVVLVLLGIVFYVSPVWRTKASSAFDDLTQWTPEQIAKDPENYMNFAEKEVEKVLQTLKANEISVAQKRGKLDQMKSVADAKIKAGTMAFEQIRDAYTNADASDAFPITWKGKEYSKENAKRQIVQLDEDIKNQMSVAKQVEIGLMKLDANRSLIAEQRSKCDAQLAKITTSREMYKVAKITDGLTKDLVAMNNVISETVSAVSDSSNDIVSLDEIAADKGSTIDDAAFDELLKKKG